LWIILLAPLEYTLQILTKFLRVDRFRRHSDQIVGHYLSDRVPIGVLCRRGNPTNSMIAIWGRLHEVHNKVKHLIGTPSGIAGKLEQPYARIRIAVPILRQPKISYCFRNGYLEE